MKVLCIAVGLISVATLAVCVHDVIVMAVVYEGKERCRETRRAFLQDGSFDRETNTIFFANASLYELDCKGERTEPAKLLLTSYAPSTYNSFVEILELHKNKQKFVEFNFSYRTIGDPKTYEHDSSTWYEIRKPTVANPIGEYKTAIHWQTYF